MAETEQVERKRHDTVTEEVATDMPTRDPETQEKLDATADLLDEIDGILETEVIEHELTMADLIRGGSLLRPQTFGTLRDCEGTCALGAAEDEAKRLGLL